MEKNKIQFELIRQKQNNRAQKHHNVRPRKIKITISILSFEPCHRYSYMVNLYNNQFGSVVVVQCSIMKLLCVHIATH